MGRWAAAIFAGNSRLSSTFRESRPMIVGRLRTMKWFLWALSTTKLCIRDRNPEMLRLIAFRTITSSCCSPNLFAYLPFRSQEGLRLEVPPSLPALCPFVPSLGPWGPAYSLFSILGSLLIRTNWWIGVCKASRKLLWSSLGRIPRISAQWGPITQCQVRRATPICCFDP